MNKTYKATFLACLTFTSIYSDINVRPAFVNNEMKFMELTFIDGYNHAKAALNAQAKNYLLGGAAAVLAGALLCTSNEIKPSYAEALADVAPKPTSTNIVISLGALIAACKTYELCQQNFDALASVNVLTNFLKEWEANKEYTPENFQPFFNELAKLYAKHGKEFFNNSATDIIEGLQFIIKRTELKVSEVYKKEFENNSSGSTIFDTPKFLNEMLKHTKEATKL